MVASVSYIAGHAAGPRIQPRRLRRSPLAEAPQHWLGGDPFMSSLFNAMSLVFPPGERHFVLSVRAAMERVTDPALLEAVRGFVTQESLHSREHADFNAWLGSFGIDAQGVMSQVEEQLEWVRQNRTLKRSLAVTCALEHFTAVMAEAWLHDDKLRAEAHPAVRDLWTWHALEEIEHRAVAFDVYQAAGGSYALRVQVMALISVGFFVSIVMLQRQLLEQAGEARNRGSTLRGLWRVWGPVGLFPRMIPRFLSYFRPGFHPSQHDVGDLVERFERELRAAGALAE